MSGESALAVRSWSVGDRTCTLTVPRPKLGVVGHAVIDWTPTAPTKLSVDELQQYRAGRNVALASIALELGITAAVLEL